MNPSFQLSGYNGETGNFRQTFRQGYHQLSSNTTYRATAQKTSAAVVLALKTAYRLAFPVSLIVSERRELLIFGQTEFTIRRTFGKEPRGGLPIENSGTRSLSETVAAPKSKLKRKSLVVP